MADKNTKISVELETKNAQTIKDLRDEFDRLKEELKQTTLAYHQGQISEADYQAKAETLKASMREVKTSVDNLGESLRKAKSGMAGFGQSALQTGRVVQDFVQGGIGGILNNIEGLSQALGGGPGLAGVLTIVGVAAFIAAPHIQKFLDSLSSDEPKTFAEEMGKIEERIKELTNKKHKIAVDYEDLEKAKDQLEAMKKIEQEIKHLRDANTSDESKQKSAVQKVIIESGKEGKVEEGMMRSGAGKEELEKDKSLQESIKRKKEIDKILEREQQFRMHQATPGFGETDLLDREEHDLWKERKKIEERIETKRREVVKKLIVDAETDAKALEKLHEAASKHPENFAPGFEERLEEALPATRQFDAEQKAAEKHIEEHKKVWKRTHDKENAEKQAKKEADRQADQDWADSEAVADNSVEQDNRRYIALKKQHKQKLQSKALAAKRAKIAEERARERSIDRRAKEYGEPIKNSLPIQMLANVAGGASPDQTRRQAIHAVDSNLAAQGVPEHHEVASKIVDDSMREIRKKMAAQSASGLSLDAKIMNVMQEFSNEQDVVIRRQRSLEQQAEQLQRQVGVRRRKT